MSKEIWCSYDSAKVLYALVYRQSDGYIYDVGDTAFEAVGTWNDARADECDIAMSSSGFGDMHFADFPSVAAGTYLVEIRERLGASPDTDDPPVAQGILFWDGSAEITGYSSDVDLTSIETKIDQVIVEQQRVNNVFDESRPGEKVVVLEKL